jgi:hypothetical protein
MSLASLIQAWWMPMLVMDRQMLGRGSSHGYVQLELVLTGRSRMSVLE